jgi:hypothetical protein
MALEQKIQMLIWWVCLGVTTKKEKYEERSRTFPLFSYAYCPRD